MHSLTVNLSDEQYDMLTDIVAEVNREDNPTEVTIEQYVGNIVSGWIESQMRGEYLNAAQTQSITELSASMGKAIDLKRARKARRQ